jgi:D-alanyl-D-alanine carboxypeptidase/D-alanyl-D-alanine-endopeptidase (penicillin-binding protein 4)
MLYFVLIIICLMPRAQAAPLPANVLSALQQAHIPLADISVEIREVEVLKPLISINSGQAMNPASTLKLLTTYAGLELLGPAYTWKTEAWLDGKLEDGILQGDLIIKGYGDPKFTLEQFWLWLRELRGRGLREIHGNVIFDSTAFKLAVHDPASFDNDPVRAYNVGPDALLLNFNALHLLFIPQGEKVKVVTEPELAGITVDNRLRPVSQGNCSNWDDAISVQLSASRLLIQGPFPVICGERAEYLSLMPHTNYINAVFRALWLELGGTVSGSLHQGSVPSTATLLATHNSVPLAELIRDINKFSNNVMARQLFLSLSLSDTAPATVALSEQAVRNWLVQKNLDFPELKLENGAGLSRIERISAHSMAELLQSAHESLLQAEFASSLPIIGVDGTLKKRLHASTAASHAHLKTGSLEGVKTIAGYIQSRSGKHWLMVFFINHPNASAGQKAQDELIEWIQNQ